MTSEETAPKVNLSAGLRMTQVQVDELPGLDTLLDGDIERGFKAVMRAVMLNVWDTSTRAEAVRTITLKVTFTPEADSSSCQVAVVWNSQIAGPVPPMKGRLMFKRTGETLAAVSRKGVREPYPFDGSRQPDVEMDSLPTLASLPGVNLAFKRELVKVLVDMDDPRTEPRQKREIKVSLAFTGDPERTMVSCTPKRIAAKLAGSRNPKPTPIYLDHRGSKLAANFEPPADLPGDAFGNTQTGRQASIEDDDEPAN